MNQSVSTKQITPGSSRDLTPRGDWRLRGDLIGQIGNTPLIPLRSLSSNWSQVEVWAKAEWFNPGGSVKDRAAANIIMQAQREGKLTQKKTLLDATSGNTGIAFAMIGSALGIRVKLCVPENASGHVIQKLKAFGAEVILTSPLESSDGAIRKAQEIYGEDPDRYFYANQYNNPANWQAHYITTGPEIWEQTEGHITHFVAGLGTTGTFMGTAAC